MDGDTIAVCRLGVRRHLGPRWSVAPACPLTYAPARVQEAGERYEAFVTARDSLAIGAKLRQEIPKMAIRWVPTRGLAAPQGDVDIECPGWVALNFVRPPSGLDQRVSARIIARLIIADLTDSTSCAGK
ncbi:hypothetical protein [Mesorhizobium sp. B2-8-9]|uniref:hypothetical protein n=1 Tax=Mesorhizobium sp. B2-8-9 TaxID=2589899 RepID=UPI00112E8A1E|nr:hypothetical protein [Mesorhizobium sp. B2-8-9]TPI74661.1 hypothetical protein FJ423_24210 [Mesorhizobium sp. B2-8-9]